MSRLTLLLLGLLAACLQPGCLDRDGDLEDVTLDTNPGCKLSCIVTWHTPELASSWVEFGENPDRTHRVGNEDLVTEHEVVVIGMRPGTKHVLQAVSVTGDGVDLRSEEFTFKTGAVPAALNHELDVWDADGAQDGWTLANVATGLLTESLVVMIDMDGDIVWYHEYGADKGRPDILAYYEGRNHVLVGPGVPPGKHPHEIDLTGHVLWEGPRQPDAADPLSAEALDGAMHHEFRRLDDGRILTFFIDIRDDIEGDEIALLDGDAQRVWSWNAWDHLTPPEEIDPTSGWTHFNSAVVEPDVMWVNSYAMSQIFEIDRDTGEILSVLGAGGDYAGDPDADEPWFTKGHSIERTAEGTLLLFDNGSINRGYSRVVEYAIDQEQKTADLVWEYPGDIADDEWFNYVWGDVDELANGNLLLTQGIGTDGSDSRIWEITRDGDIVWQFRWSHDLDAVGSYAAERFPALAEPL